MTVIYSSWSSRGGPIESVIERKLSEANIKTNKNTRIFVSVKDEWIGENKPAHEIVSLVSADLYQKKNIHISQRLEDELIREVEELFTDPEEQVGYINLKKLREICHKPSPEFEKLGGEMVMTQNGLPYIYIKRPGAKILGVAHLDTVQTATNWSRLGDRLYVPQLDDRLGVYLLLEVLHKYGIAYDILLTDGEESGQSTAQYFTPESTDVEYNWIFELDRMGTTTALYQYETQEYRNMLREYGLKVAHGSFTDICYMDDFNLFAANFAVAYHDNHSLGAYLKLDTLNEELLPNIIRFLQDKQHEKLAHVPRSHRPRKYFQSRAWENTEINVYNNGRNGNGRERTESLDTWSITTCTNCLSSNFITDKYCHNCSTLLTKFCPICDKDTCGGLSECATCLFSFHNDKFIESFTMCRECLLVTFGFDEEFVHTLDRFQFHRMFGEDEESVKEEIIQYMERWAAHDDA